MARDLGFTPQGDAPFFFLSYNSEDQKRVGEYARYMADCGLPIWYDKGIKVGTKSWEKSIADHINASQCVIMFLSRGIFKKGKSFVHKEFEMATEYFGREVIVVLLDRIEKSEVPSQFVSWWIDVTGMQGIQAFEYDSMGDCVARIFEAIGFEPVAVEAEPATAPDEVQIKKGRVTGAKNPKSKAYMSADGMTPAAKKTGGYQFPPIELLTPDVESLGAKKLLQLFERAKVKLLELTYSAGPLITRYEVRPHEKTRPTAIAKLAGDIGMLFGTTQVRIEQHLPGKPGMIGIELPRQHSEVQFLRPLIENEKFKEGTSPVNACLGVDVTGEPVYLDIAKLPHVLIAGAAGSGHLSCLNTVVTSILYRSSPAEVRFLLIDTTTVYMECFKNLPHLMLPVISNSGYAAAALEATVVEMEKRYYDLAGAGVRNIDEYNRQTSGEKMPRIVVIINDLADLMLTVHRSVENSLMRLASKARATGIHIVATTGKPGPQTVTGIIKANIPSRIAFYMPTATDSRAVIDEAGAEKLIGKNDMLYKAMGSRHSVRLQAALVSDSEAEAVANYINENNARAQMNAYYKMNTEAAYDRMFSKRS